MDLVKNNTGCLVLSLDFELIWGVFDRVDIFQKKKYFDNTLAVIPDILDCFSSNEVQATWATVGMLFNNNWEEWEFNKPQVLPSYKNHALNAYAYGNAHKKSNLDRFFFAPDLIRLIKATRGQEVASHTYSHYYCLEAGQTQEHFSADLGKAQELAGAFGISLQSLVFPRNQFNETYLKSCEAVGITAVRSNPSVWYWDVKGKETLPKKICRTLDAYVPLGKKSYAWQALQNGSVLCEPASRFLRPQSRYALLNTVSLNRIKREMVSAARQNEIYHLWWHPHNFGNDPKASLKALNAILETYRFCREMYGMQSLTMNQVCANYSPLQ